MLRRLAVALAIAAAASPTYSARLLVVSKDDASLRSFDATSYAPQFTVKLPGDPHVVLVSPDGRFAYVGDFEGRNNTISIIDVEAGKKVDAIDLTPNYRPHGLAVTRDGSTLYATCEASRTVAVLDLNTRVVTRKIDIRDSNIHMLALSPDEKHVYATSSYSGMVWFVDLAQEDKVAGVYSGNGCEGIVLVDKGGEIWAVNRVSQTLSVIDVSKRKVVATIDCVGNPMRAALTPDGSTVLVSCALRNEIALFDVAERKEVERIQVGNFPIDIAITPDGKRYFVSNGRAAEVAVVDAARREVVGRIPVGPSPEGIDYVE